MKTKHKADDPRKHERWRRLAGFVRKWHRKPLGREDGCPEEELERAEERLGRPLPLALREWFLLVGRRPDVTDRRARSITPAELKEEFVVYVDRPLEWSVRQLRADDPPVVLSVDGARPVEVAPLSRFLLMMALREAAVSSPVRWWGEALGAPDAVAALRAAYPALPLPEWIETTRARFHGDTDTLLLIGDGDVRAIARTRSAWNRLHKVAKRKAKKLWRTFEDA